MQRKQAVNHRLSSNGSEPLSNLDFDAIEIVVVVRGFAQRVIGMVLD